MAYFSGEYEGKVDPKGRVVLPARLKSLMPELDPTHLMINRGFEPCLVLYPMVEWNKVFSKVAGLNEFNEEYRQFQRNFLRGSSEVELDSNGRFLVPKSMLRFANIDKDVLIVGIGNRMEIWNPSTYDQYLLKDPKELSGLAEKFLGDKS